MTIKPKPLAPLSIVALSGAAEMGKKIDKHLVDGIGDVAKPEDFSGSFLIENKCPRFASGDGKGLIKRTVRGTDLFILVDVGNYSCTYEMFGSVSRMSPDDHFQDLKRIIQAASGKAQRINVIMPNLYGGRQHKRNYRESLDCACALQELEAMGVENLITFDAHDARVHNAVPLMGFDNFMPAYQVLKTLFKKAENLEINDASFAVVSPDEGAIHRNMFYASSLGVQLGMFYKRRDFSVIKNGMNPIVEHKYLGNSVEGKDILVCDDIIGSGGSMLEVAAKLKERGAKRIITYATYTTFTHGLDKFDKAYADGLIDYVFGTNLSYLTPELLSREWFKEVDVSKFIAYIISALNYNVSISRLIDSNKKITALLEKHGINSAKEVDNAT